MPHVPRQRLPLLAALLATAGLLAACASDVATVDVAQGTVIDNVTVVDTRTGALSPGMTLVLDQGRIARMLPMSTQQRLTVASGVTRVDGSG